MSLLSSSFWPERANCFYRDINCQSPLYLWPVKGASPQLIKHLELNTFPQVTREQCLSIHTAAWDLSPCHPDCPGKEVQPAYLPSLVYLGLSPQAKVSSGKAAHFQRQHSKCYILPHHSSSLFSLIKHLWTLLKSRWPFPRFPLNAQPRHPQ